MEWLWILAAGCMTAMAAAAGGVMIRYRRQMKSICRQLQFIKSHQTNMKVTADGMWFGMGLLADELNDLLVETEEKRREVQSQEKVIRETVANLSHDIRTPLTSLDGYVQLLEEAVSGEDQARYIRIIRKRLEALRGILDELFLYAKLQDNAYQPELTCVELNKIVYDTVFSFYEDCKTRGLEPRITVCEERVYTSGNERMIGRMLLNLIKNSLEHGKDDVRICLETRGNQIVFSCANRTEHAEQIDTDRVFDRFYRADSARTTGALAGGSTGLGLSIARSLAEKIGAVMSASLDGDIFTVTVVFDRIEAEPYDCQLENKL